MTLTEFYQQLLILQYYNQPKAKAEIGAKAKYYQQLQEFSEQLKQEFDLDNAIDDRLDKIGKLVGIKRVVPFSTAKILFGFEGDATARGFSDLFDSTAESAPFSSLFTPDYTATQLDNETYRAFIKAKISNNIVRAVMVGDENSVSLQDAIQTLFNNNAVVFDNKNMTLSLQVGFDFDEALLILILQAGLLPSPQGVGYKIIYGADTNSFGFADDENAKGMGDLFDPSIGGTFSTLYFY